MSETLSASPSVRSAWLANFPVSLFAAVMGLAGLAQAWRKAHEVMGQPVLISEILLAVALTVFGILAIVYLLKWRRHPESVHAELNHPGHSNFFSTIPMGTLLLAAGLYPYEPLAAHAFWLASTGFQLILSIRTLNRWLQQSQHLEQLTPAWLIPIVGNLVVPLLGSKLGYTETSWFFFSVGLLFWMPLLTIILYRIIFVSPLPQKQAPLLFILQAPPSVAFLAYTALNGEILDSFGRVLIGFALFHGLLLLTLATRFILVPFSLSWLAYTFPLTALTLAAIQWDRLNDTPSAQSVAETLLAATTLVVVLVLGRTLLGFFWDEIPQKE